MCGVFDLTMTVEALKAAFPEVEFDIDYTPRFKITPFQMVPVITNQGNGSLHASNFQWGLVAQNVKGKKLSLFLARAETISKLPSFRDSFQHRRCLIPASAFYETVKIDGSKEKVYIHFHMKTQKVFAFAGIWQKTILSNGIEVNAAIIITTEPNALVKRFHPRMPVILPEEAHTSWLNPKPNSLNELQALLKPYPESEMDCFPVTSIAIGSN
jgi:putative SOS response-associated peptidase YedK